MNLELIRCDDGDILFTLGSRQYRILLNNSGCREHLFQYYGCLPIEPAGIIRAHGSRYVEIKTPDIKFVVSAQLFKLLSKGVKQFLYVRVPGVARDGVMRASHRTA